MTDEELWLKHIEEYPQIKSWSEEKREGARKGFKSGLAEGRKDLEKENAELKVRLGISEHDREHNDYELSEAYETIKKLKAQIEKMKCCGNCKYRIKKNLEGKIWVELCEKSYIKNICKDWELAE